ncbi:hypothetical protein MCB86_02240 [Pseudomonas sp. KSR10]|uniref:hypothetical protein n=1 Tax=Pseudomonas sp. KSR10 TaxID=2916654 RepID=UPI001EF91FE5|nr:hypothetical protein [Pseudomonas sp. KSR10]MCG6538892.1 hypothetical protein [Pseudomonas sp. KSR10]
MDATQQQAVQPQAELAAELVASHRILKTIVRIRFSRSLQIFMVLSYKLFNYPVSNYGKRKEDHKLQQFFILNSIANNYPKDVCEGCNNQVNQNINYSYSHQEGSHYEKFHAGQLALFTTARVRGPADK